MNTHALDMPTSRHLSAEEYMRAKLDYETTPFDLKRLLDKTPEKIMLLDVRDKGSYDKEHIPGAMNVPEREIGHQMGNLPQDRQIVVYSWDANCALAPHAAMGLARKGFKVRLLAGGLEDWKRRDLLVEKRPLARRGATV